MKKNNIVSSTLYKNCTVIAFYYQKKNILEDIKEISFYNDDGTNTIGIIFSDKMDIWQWIYNKNYGKKLPDKNKVDNRKNIWVCVERNVSLNY